MKMENITIDQFHHIEMKIGTILKAEYIEGADKLLRLEVDFGPIEVLEVVIDVKNVPQTNTSETQAEKNEEVKVRDIRQILSGIRQFYRAEDLIGKQCPFVTNLLPRTMRGLESHGMILAVGGLGGSAILLHPDKEVSSGSKLR